MWHYYMPNIVLNVSQPISFVSHSSTAMRVLLSHYNMKKQRHKEFNKLVKDNSIVNDRSMILNIVLLYIFSFQIILLSSLSFRVNT